MTQVRRVIVGQDEVIEQVMIALFVGGHCLITGLPGTAKTLLVRTLAQTLGLEFRRIQFTPDLMPSDITGTDIIEEDPGTGRRTWTFVPGPIFANVLLADEINRTPPKTQSALLEAMQELSCTVRGNHYKIAPPFFVLATQNPIELEGTYPLPEAQLDRFIFNVLLDYLVGRARNEGAGPDHHDAHRAGGGGDHRGRDSRFSAGGAHGADRRFGGALRGGSGARDARHRCEPRRISSRSTSTSAPACARRSSWCWPSKARALMRHRYHVSYEDVIALMRPILRHRILLNFQAESDRLTQDDILKKLLEAMPPPSDNAVQNLQQDIPCCNVF